MWSKKKRKKGALVVTFPSNRVDGSTITTTLQHGITPTSCACVRACVCKRTNWVMCEGRVRVRRRAMQGDVDGPSILGGPPVPARGSHWRISTFLWPEESFSGSKDVKRGKAVNGHDVWRMAGQRTIRTPSISCLVQLGNAYPERSVDSVEVGSHRGSHMNMGKKRR